MRRDFALPEDDIEGLNGLGPEWETVQDPAGQWFLLHQFELPNGYNHQCASVAIQIPSNYPTAPLDMAYFHPHLARLDGQPLRQVDARQPINGKEWQRWSRHYAWIVGRHNLCTHIVLVRHWLNVALGKG